MFNFRRGSTEAQLRHRAVLCNRKFTSALSRFFVLRELSEKSAMEYFESTVELQNLQTLASFECHVNILPISSQVLTMYMNRQCVFETFNIY